MSSGHLALIVEDDQAIAAGLVEILKAAGCESVVTDNKTDALSLMRERLICLVLLDLEIKGDPMAIKGHTAHGTSLLRDIRSMYGKHTGSCWWLPVLVVSGFARERDEAIAIMRDGASDIIEKPYKAREVSNAILAELQRCGRQLHAHCLEAPKPVPQSPNTEVGIAISGKRKGLRTQVIVAQTSLWLTNSELRMLLQLIAAHLKGKGVHKIDFGAKIDQGFKGMSRLARALEPAFGGELKIITNDHHGSYFLAPGVIVRDCNADSLTGIGDVVITSLAREIARGIADHKSKG